MGSAPEQQLIHLVIDTPDRQSALRVSPTTEVPAEIKVQLQQESTQTHRRNTLGALGSLTWESVPLNRTGHLLRKSTLPSLRDIIYPPNT